MNNEHASILEVYDLISIQPRISMTPLQSAYSYKLHRKLLSTKPTAHIDASTSQTV